MKTSILSKSLILAAAFIGLTFLFSSCSKEEMKPAADNSSVQTNAARGGDALTSTTIVHLPGLVEDKSGSMNPNIQPDMEIFNTVDHSVINNPAGHAVLYKDYMKVTGKATIKCVTSGNSVTVNMNNLIPRGVYTIWIQVFNDRGYDGTLNNMIAYGAVDGHNNFKASASGLGQLSVTLPGGPLILPYSGTLWGDINDCLVSSGTEFHIIGVYQSNGETYGWTPGREGLFVEHFRFVFKPHA